MKKLPFYFRSEKEKLLYMLARPDIKFVKCLVRNGINVNIKTHFGATALHLAAYEVDLPATEFFLSRGAEVNAKDDYDRTALHYVNLNFQESDTDEVAKLLLSEGADVNFKDKDGNTALHYAADRGAMSLVKLYLKHKAEVNSKNLRDVIPLVKAIEIGSIEMVEFLISHGSNVNNLDKTVDRVPLNLACDKRYYRIVECLFLHGASGDFVDYYGETSLQKAIESERPKLVDLLLNHNVDVNVKNLKDETAIFYAIRFDNNDLVKRLIDIGANVNNINESDERTPLNLACHRENFEVIEYLLQNGADPDEFSSLGLPTLSSVLDLGYPFNAGKKTTVELLLLYGADVNILSLCGNSFLKFGHEKHCKKLVLQQVAKLQELNLPVHSNIVDGISKNNDFSNCLDECRRELSKAKGIKLRNCWVTFFNLLTDDFRNLVNYAGNQDLIEDFDRTNFKDEFPIYGESMQKRFSKGLRVRKFWDLATSNLSKILLILNPTHLIIRDILDCFNEKDLIELLH